MFLDILETCYFGTHVTTARISQLFSHLLPLDCFYNTMMDLRNKMRLYKISTGLTPFPNARDLYSQMEEAINQQNYQACLLYYLLCQYSEEVQPYQIFQNNRQLLNRLRIDDGSSAIVSEGLLNLSKEDYLVASPKESEEVLA